MFDTISRSICLLLLSSLFYSHHSLAQYRDPDFASWNWMRVEGTVENPKELEDLENKIAYSMEVHLRLKQDQLNFHQMLLRPMAGYKIDDSTTLWLGYAYILQDRDGQLTGEHRSFQMMTYGKRIGESPIIFLGNTRLEQRHLENTDEINLRLRQMAKVSIDLFKLKDAQFRLYFQDEIFFRFNQTAWSGPAGFDQNRFQTGLEVKTPINALDVTFNLGYLQVNTPNSANNLKEIILGVTIKIPENKRKKEKNQSEDDDQN